MLFMKYKRHAVKKLEEAEKEAIDAINNNKVGRKEEREHTRNEISEYFNKKKAKAGEARGQQDKKQTEAGKYGGRETGANKWRKRRSRSVLEPVLVDNSLDRNDSSYEGPRRPAQASQSALRTYKKLIPLGGSADYSTDHISEAHNRSSHTIKKSRLAGTPPKPLSLSKLKANQHQYKKKEYYGIYLPLNF